MKKEISAYLEYVNGCIKSGNTGGNFPSELLTRIKFYQHERLIHLIVTMTFAIMTVISFFILMTSGGTGAALLSLLFLGLTIPYVTHYYFLENSVQSLQRIYFQLTENKNA